MRALVFHEHGDADVLVYKEVSAPEPAPDEVLLRVRACGINALDIFARQGATETGVPLPMILGADVSGEVEALGEDVEGLHRGARAVVNPRFYCGKCLWCLRGQQSACAEYRVLGWHRLGGYAEYVALPATNIRELATEVSYAEAAALPITFTTAWRMLIERARVQAGETVLVLGASGGVATAAIQIAAMIGARVGAVTSGVAKVTALSALHPEVIIDRDTEDVTARVLEWTDGVGVEVIVQTQGGPTWGESLRQVARLGRIVTCSALQGNDPPVDFETVIWKQVTLIGSTGGSPLDFEQVVVALESGRLRPLVHRTFPLGKGADAHRAFERREHVGKLVLEI